MLERAAQSATPQCGLGNPRQLLGRANRLSSARRAPRLDRRHSGVRAHRLPPVRLRGCAGVLAGGSGRGPDARGCRAAVRAAGRPVRAVRRAGRAGRLGRRGRAAALGALPALRRRGRAAPPVPEHVPLGGRPDRGARPRNAVRRAGLPARRLARTGRPAGQPGRRDDRPDPGRHRLPGAGRAGAGRDRGRAGRGRRRGEVRRAGRERPAGLPRRVRDPERRRPATRRPATRWRCSLPCCARSISVAGPPHGWWRWCASSGTASPPVSSAPR